MEKLEYDLRLKNLKEDFEKYQKKLNIEFALSNNPYKVGDIIKDHCCRIRIERIGTYISYDKYPTCYYFGVKLNNNGEDNKLGKKETIYQINIL